MHDPRRPMEGGYGQGPSATDFHGWPQDPRHNPSRIYQPDSRYAPEPSRLVAPLYSYQPEHQQYPSYNMEQQRCPPDTTSIQDARHLSSVTYGVANTLRDEGPRHRPYAYELPDRGCEHRYTTEQTSKYPPYQAPGTTARAQGMDPIISTVGNNHPNYFKMHPTAQQRSFQNHSPPPAYTRQPGLQLASHSSRSSFHSPSPIPSRTGQLADGYKLVAIPATSSALGSPFLRAYAPVLESYGISREAFLQFLDHLNRVAVASPPIQVLGLAGNIVGMVPLHTAQIVGNAVDLAAKVSTVVVSKGRTEILLREANSTIFAAAGLKAQVAKLDVVAKLANIPILDGEGKINKNCSILMPFEEEQGLHIMSAQERRLKALSTWVSPLDLESLPGVDSNTNVFGKMHAAVSERQRKKEEEKIIKDRQKMQKKTVRGKDKEYEYEEKMEEYTAKEARIREKQGRRMGKELRELEEKRERASKEHDKTMHKIEKERRKHDKEEGSMRKILFLMIQTV